MIIHLLVDTNKKRAIILEKSPKKGLLDTVKFPHKDVIDFIFSLKGKWDIIVLS